MRYLKRYDKYDKYEYLGLKKGDGVVFNDKGSSNFIAGKEYIIDKIVDLYQSENDPIDFDEIEKDEITKDSDFIYVIDPTTGERVKDNYNKDLLAYAYRFTSPAKWAEIKFGL